LKNYSFFRLPGEFAGERKAWELVGRVSECRGNHTKEGGEVSAKNRFDVKKVRSDPSVTKRGKEFKG